MGEPWLDIGYDMNQFRKDMAKADEMERNKMGKVKGFYTNELLLEREDDIRNLNKKSRKLHKEIGSLKYSLLQVRAELNEIRHDGETKIVHYTMEESEQRVKNSLEIIKKALRNE